MADRRFPDGQTQVDELCLGTLSWFTFLHFAPAIGLIPATVDGNRA
jgi:hypothetical protein